jgi:non-specific serine/threonine protein kinase
MELLDGEPLSERLRRGPLTVTESVPIALQVLAALSAMHAIGVVHRDLKPSNIFLTPHGVKLLDFGLARPMEADPALAAGSDLDLTRTGTVVGTPRYMAPEQITGDPIDGRSDLFAVGLILFEMLAGRPAFEGRNAVAILHAALHEQPPALTGSPAVAAVDRVIRRALAKRPAERPATADAMAGELRAVRGSGDGDSPALARALTRIVVLPFRILRADPETDFLAFSLADAIATSLSGISSLVVRSGAAASRFGGEQPDFKALAAEADVDLVVVGTLLRAGDQVRAAAQLVEVPAGTLVASHTVQASLGDLFHLQDDIAHRVVEALSLPLSGRDARTAPDTPNNARAYEFYLRANDLARTYERMPVARDLYLQCLQHDPTYAPAWARLGRSYQIIGKYIEDADGNYPRAEDALRKALELAPDLSIAHKFYSQIEADLGRAPQALERLLDLATRRSDDPELFAALVHVCRFCGLFEESLAAYEEAHRLDPNVLTSWAQTLFMVGDTERLLQIMEPDNPMAAFALTMAGRRDEARQLMRGLKPPEAPIPVYVLWMKWLSAWIDGRRDEMVSLMDEQPAQGIKIFEDPEVRFQDAWMLCEVGAHAQALPLLQGAVMSGYYPAAVLKQSPHFDALRGNPVFQSVLETADSQQRRARDLFRDGGGEKLLGQLVGPQDRTAAQPLQAGGGPS